MKAKIVLQEQYLPDRIVQLIEQGSRTDAPTGGYSNAVEFALLELIREKMRELAQDFGFTRDRGRLLTAAIGSAADQVEALLEGKGLPADLKQYLERAREKLGPAANELQELGGRLDVSQKTGKLVPRAERSTESRRAFEVRQIGLAESVEGLLALPASEVHEISTERLEYDLGCQVVGDWFPFEVPYEDLVLVIDDDGSVYVSVENLPPRLVEQARKLIEKIAGLLYA